MPDSCCIVGCENRRVGNNSSLPFYRVPRGKTPIEKRRRQEWVKAANKEDWDLLCDEKISNFKICGEHFVKGKRSEDSENIDWIPTVFSHPKNKKKSEILKNSKRKKRYETIESKRLHSSFSFEKAKAEELMSISVSENEEIPDFDVSVIGPCSDENLLLNHQYNELEVKYESAMEEIERFRKNSWPEMWRFMNYERK